ncbi:hypothetical protein E3N88_10028 [Mikania micrantha]|uniref:Uncharacterized protein n=1 Tax=Mikania micrantha TaxID=192012 RepID=A0A5N6PBT3_9ASTR|nr:hypothetical protein E3N88_10028 [Mikania micrantha]
MFNYSRTILLQRTSRSTCWSNLKTISIPVYYNHTSSSSVSLSIWRRKKEMGKEGLIIAKELKRLESSPARLDRFIKSHVSRLLKSDLVSILFEFQRQDLVFLSLKAPDPPLSLPYRVIMKGLLPYPELRERVKLDFLQLFPDMIVYDPPEDLFEDYYSSSKESSECNS